MEGGHGRSDFFFHHSYQGIDTIARYVRQRFSHLFEGLGLSGQEAFDKSARTVIIKNAETKYTNGIALSQTFAIDIEKQTIVEYFLLLERLEVMNKKNG